ncbi:helix-turn-helix domain-containing protein [Bdellovibrionota bacterium FG-2]
MSSKIYLETDLLLDIENGALATQAMGPVNPNETNQEAKFAFGDKPLTPTELAEFYTKSVNTVYYWVSNPNFPRIKVGKALRFDLAKVQDYFAEQTELNNRGACQFPAFAITPKRSKRSLKTSVNASRVDSPKGRE